MQWNFVPFVSVRPLKSGANHEGVVETECERGCRTIVRRVGFQYAVRADDRSTVFPRPRPTVEAPHLYEAASLQGDQTWRRRLGPAEFRVAAIGLTASKGID